jgi:hypothetical protein
LFSPSNLLKEYQIIKSSDSLVTILNEVILNQRNKAEMEIVKKFKILHLARLKISILYRAQNPAKKI